MTTVQSFFIELINRIRAKSPKFFLVLSLIMGALTGAAKVPYVLKHWFNIDVPSHFVEMCNDIANIALGFFLAAGLAKKDVPVAQTPEGGAIIVTDEKKFPFTAKAEEKKVEETAPPPPVFNVPENKS